MSHTDSVAAGLGGHEGPGGWEEASLSGPADVARTFMEMTTAIADGAETVEVCTRLAHRCVALLPVAAAGILLRDPAGSLQVIGASSPSAHLLDLFQVQNDEGPCLECLASGEAVADVGLADSGRWPRFSALARQQDFSAVYALPLQSRDVTVGALNLFARWPLPEERLVIAQALADIATLSLLHVDARVDSTLLIQRIRLAVESRNTLDQARGMVAERDAASPALAHLS